MRERKISQNQKAVFTFQITELMLTLLLLFLALKESFLLWLKRSFLNSVKTIENGRNLVIFPEGTRSKDGKLGKGRTGAALIAAKAHTEIVPVGIIFEGEKLHFRSKITVRYGKPISSEGYFDENGEPVLRKLVKLKNQYMDSIRSLIGQDIQEDKKID